MVFVVNGDHVKAVPVKIGFCDDNYWEITDGLTNGEEIVSGGYRAIGRDLAGWLKNPCRPGRSGHRGAKEMSKLVGKRET